jgi:GT2 family glycosyltransferase
LKVSIVIPLYNARQDYTVCFQSLAKQTLAPFEVIGVDSNSADGSVELIERDFPWVSIIRCSTNMGYRNGAQLGASRAKGDLLVVVNQDVEFAPDFLAELVKPMQADASVGLTAPLILLYGDREKVNEAGNTFHFSGLYGSRGLGLSRTAYSGTTELGMVSGCCFCIRTSLWLQLDGFSSHIDSLESGWHAGNEDQDLCWRARLLGHSIKLVCTSILYHKYSRKPWKAERLASYYGCYVLLLVRMLKWRTLLVLSPFVLFNFGLLWLKAGMGGWRTVRPMFRMQWKILCHTKRIPTLRRSVQALRQVKDATILACMETTLPVSEIRPLQALYDGFGRVYYVFFRRLVTLIAA